MTDKINSYLPTIGCEIPIIDRVKIFYKIYQALLCPEEIINLLVTEDTNNEGLREYKSLWFFSENFAMETKDIITADVTQLANFDMMTIKNSIVYWDIKSKSFGFQEATIASKLNVDIKFRDTIYADFQVSQKNCEYFMSEIFQRHIKPNFIKP